MLHEEYVYLCNVRAKRPKIPITHTFCEADRDGDTVTCSERAPCLFKFTTPWGLAKMFVSCDCVKLTSALVNLDHTTGTDFIAMVVDAVEVWPAPNRRVKPVDEDAAFLDKLGPKRRKVGRRPDRIVAAKDAVEDGLELLVGASADEGSSSEVEFGGDDFEFGDGEGGDVVVAPAAPVEAPEADVDVGAGGDGGALAVVVRAGYTHVAFEEFGSFVLKDRETYTAHLLQSFHAECGSYEHDRWGRSVVGSVFIYGIKHIYMAS